MESLYNNLKDNIMNYKTIKQYLGGGYAPNGYYRGGSVYDSDISSDMSQVRLQQYMREKREDSAKQAEEMLKAYQDKVKKSRGAEKILGWVADKFIPEPLKVIEDMALTPVFSAVGNMTRVSGKGAVTPDADTWNRSELLKIKEAQDDELSFEEAKKRGQSKAIGRVADYLIQSQFNPKAEMMQKGASKVPTPNEQDSMVGLGNYIKSNIGEEPDLPPVQSDIALGDEDLAWVPPIDELGQKEGGKVSLKDYVSLVDKMINSFGGEVPQGMYTEEGGMTKEGYAQEYGLAPETVKIDTISFRNPANYMFEISGNKKDSGAGLTGTTRATSSLPIERLLDSVMDKNIEDPFERMRWKTDLSKIKKGIQYNKGGGLINPMSYARRIV